MSIINSSLEHTYCSNLVSNHSLVRLISLNSSRNLQANYIIYFLFRLDLILNACKILFRCDRFEILNFAIKQGLSQIYLLDLWACGSIWSSTKMVVWTPIIRCEMRLSVHDVLTRGAVSDGLCAGSAYLLWLP